MDSFGRGYFTLRQCANAANSGCNILGLSSLLVEGTGGGGIALGLSWGTEDMAVLENDWNGAPTY